MITLRFPCAGFAPMTSLPSAASTPAYGVSAMLLPEYWFKSGFTSKLSTWLTPPQRKIQMTDFALGAKCGLPSGGCHAVPAESERATPSRNSIAPNASPVKPIPVSARNDRRVTPPQYRSSFASPDFMPLLIANSAQFGKHNFEADLIGRSGGTSSTSPILVSQRKWDLTELVPPISQRVFDLSNNPVRHSRDRLPRRKDTTQFHSPGSARCRNTGKPSFQRIAARRSTSVVPAATT